MKPIACSFGDPSVFELGRYVVGLWLGGRWAEPDNTWAPQSGFVFSLRKSLKSFEPELKLLDSLSLEISKSDWKLLKSYLSDSNLGKELLERIKV
jgi:hypothetical protein